MVNALLILSKFFIIVIYYDCPSTKSFIRSGMQWLLRPDTSVLIPDINKKYFSTIF